MGYMSAAPFLRPPSFVPRALAAASAALVRALIASLSCWATTAITPTVIVFASGRSSDMTFGLYSGGVLLAVKREALEKLQH
jgi:hypothetical protein